MVEARQKKKRMKRLKKMCVWWREREEQTEEVRSQRVNPGGNKEIDTELSPSVSAGAALAD